MARAAKKVAGGDLGFEAELFRAADKLRGNMEPSDYKHVALGLIFLKHISEGFEAKRAQLLAEYPDSAEDEDEYRADNVFWVPPLARWSHLQANARQPGIGKVVDDAMLEIEKVNPGLKGVLPKDYARPGLNAVMLGELIDLISGIGFKDGADASRDVLGRVYEYFLGQFAAARASAAASSTPRVRSSARWSRCWSPTRAGSTIRAAAPGACSSSPRSSSRATVAASATSPSMVRSRTTPRGGWR